jgi:hypothetical protein
MFLMLGLAPAGHAQTLDPPVPSSTTSNPCPSRDIPSSSNLLVRSLVTEWALLAQDWCKVREWDHPWPNTQELLVDALVGRGLHPTGGIVVPGSGPAAGLALNLDWNERAPSYGRFATNVEARGSENGFWEAGARLQTLFAAYVENGRSPQFTLTAKHWDLSQLPFYGLGNDTSEHSRTLFGLRATEIASSLDVPLPLGFTLAGELAGLWFDPESSTTFGTVNNETTAPGLHGDTAYVRPRLVATWRYPVADVLYGFSTVATVSYELDQALRGGPHSFDRLEARWSVGLGLGPDIGALRFTSHLTISDPHAGNRVPFYRQPTLGGADINDENSLRGYHDYRFRAPNLIAYEISYERQIIDPLGFRLFVEAGKVGLQPGDLGFHGLKSSVGVAATFRLGGATVAEISLGWSAREGVHAYATGNTNNAGGVNVGLRGVF